jgi:hypothetical protein
MARKAKLLISITKFSNKQIEESQNNKTKIVVISTNKKKEEK